MELISAIGVFKNRAAALIRPDCCLKEMAKRGTVLSGTVWKTPDAPPLLAHSQGHTHTLLADLPLTYFHFILLSPLNSTRAIGILAVCHTMK